MADQTLRGDRHYEQLRTQAAALRSTAAQLSRTIADTAKAAAKQNNGNSGRGNGNDAAPPNRKANGNPNDDDNGGLAGGEMADGQSWARSRQRPKSEPGSERGPLPNQGKSIRRKWI